MTHPFNVLELRYKIALDIPISNLSNLCVQSKQWKEVCDSEDFWRLRFKKDFLDKWRLKDKNYKESYQFWYKVLLKLRPFDYYPDDQQILNNVPKFTYDGIQEYTSHVEMSERMILTGSIDVLQEITLYYDNSIYDNLVYNMIPVLDFFVINNIDQIRLISDYFKLIGLDRINITLPESIDLLFCLIGTNSISNHSSRRSIYSILSSLNYNQLSTFVNGKEGVRGGGKDYGGFLIYSLMLFTAVTNKRFSEVDINDEIENPEGEWTFALPEEFDFQRYKVVKQFDLDKIIWLWRAYYGSATMDKFPPYFYVTCSKANLKLEELYRKINSYNYISILESVGIKTDDNPTYYQALARLTIEYDLTWIEHYRRYFACDALGIPVTMVNSLYDRLQMIDVKFVIIKYLKTSQS